MRYEVLALERGLRSGLPLLNIVKVCPDTRSSWIDAYYSPNFFFSFDEIKLINIVLPF